MKTRKQFLRLEDAAANEAMRCFQLPLDFEGV